MGRKGNDHEQTKEVLGQFQWVCVFWFREHLDFGIDFKCGHLVRRYLKDGNKVLYFVELHFNYLPRQKSEKYK